MTGSTDGGDRTGSPDRLVERRRAFHRRPEPGWCEFLTTSLLVDELESIGVDELHVGREALPAEARMAVPDEAELRTWFERAREAGAREDVLAATEGGHTGAVAVLDRGEGPHVALRVDIDGLPVEESIDGSHRPAAEGFRSAHEGWMHACGHDAHMTIGLGVLEAVKASDFEGRFTVLFQPAEEVGGGGKPMAESEHLEGVDYLLAVHIGLGHPSGEVVGGAVEQLAVSNVRVGFRGRSAHAGKEPNEGANAMQATAAAVGNAYGIPRHADGATRVNFGRAEVGTASNVVAEEATLEGEVRGETTELMEYTREELRRIVRAAGEMHDCASSFEVVSGAPRADSDEELAELVTRVAAADDRVDSTVTMDSFGASEDATHPIETVQDAGGLATYAIVGTDHPGAHHTPTFDVEEADLALAVGVLAGSVLRVAEGRPGRGERDGSDDREGVTG
ncbi:amidohydrolase [Halobacteriales archaeon QS_5_70_15]|nr:MAG: amidohydrolase [Halobacteriales archaeon QS_5_70_15]